MPGFPSGMAGRESRAMNSSMFDEAATVEKGVKYAMDILRREEDFVPKTSVEKLKPLDQLVLAVAFVFRGSGHAITILEKVSEMSGKRVLLGSILGSLDMLERKGLIESRPANPETESERKDFHYFMATMAGERALADAKATSETIAGLLGDLA